jgi:hypothetical protein
MSWILGIIGGFYIVLIWNNFNFSTISFPSYLCSIWWYLFVMALLWAWIFERIIPDRFDILGAGISIEVIVIFYLPY